MLSSPTMGRLRQRLAWIVGGWLVFQTAALMIAPLSMCAGAVVAPEQACTCALEGATECPMHHHSTTQSKAKSDCDCRSTADPAAAILRSLLGPTAITTDVSRHAEPLFSSTLYPHSVLQPLSQFVVPDSPPPRA